MNRSERIFRTSNLALAAFLLCKGAKLDDILHIPGSPKAFFIFAQTSEAKKFMNRYEFGLSQDPGVMVDFRDAFSAIRSIKERLYSKKDGKE